MSAHVPLRSQRVADRPDTVDSYCLRNDDENYLSLFKNMKYFTNTILAFYQLFSSKIAS